MDNLWAPWRMNYIIADKDTKTKTSVKCIFCKLIGEKDDAKNLILSRTQLSFSILNKFPYNNGHIMVSPLRHIASIETLNEKEQTDLFALIINTKQIIDKALRPQGYNIGINIGKAAGAGIENHLHIHIVPRWNADTNFMPITASTKVIPQSLGNLYKELKRYAKK